MKSNIFSLLKFFIGWPLSLLALFFIGKLLTKQGLTIFTQAHQFNFILLVLGILSFLIYFFLRTFFWQKLLHFENHFLPYTQTSFLWQISEIKRFIPGNIWSFLGRATAFESKGVAKKTTTKLLAFEMFYIVVGSIVASFLSIPFLLSYKLISEQQAIILCFFSIFFVLLVFFTISKISTFSRLEKYTKLLLSHSFGQHIILFVISTMSFVFFGLGMYLSTLSLLSLPQLIYNPWIIGLFCLSFIIGYLSIITPMGLGVREAVIVWGLTPIVSVSSAGFIAIFTRVVSIVAELLFCVISLALTKITKNPFFSLKNFFIKYKHEIILVAVVCLYIAYFSIASFLRYQNYYTGRFDLGNMDQTVWNTVHGRIFQLTNPDGTNIISRLSFHADFILIFLAPFYWFWQDPKMLLLIQSVIVGIGGIFVYLLAKSSIKSKLVALIFAFVYCINPSVGFANLYDFHAVTLATTFFFAAFYFLQKRKFSWYILFLFLAGITKEQVWIAIALLGIYTFFKYNKKIGTAITIAASFMFVFLFFYAIPKAHGGDHFALAYYSDYGSSSSQIAKTLLFSPLKTLQILTSQSRISYLVQLFFPVGFLALISPLFLIFIIPELLLNMLSSTPNLHQIYYQYTAVLTPFIFASAIFGYQKLQNKFSNIKNILPVLLCICAIYSAYLFGPLPFSKTPNIDMFTKPLSYATTIDDFIDFIPVHYSIAATNNLGSHLSHRQKIFTIPLGIDEADVIVFLLNDKFAQPSLDAQGQMVAKLMKDPNYVELFREQNFVAFAKKSLNFQKRLKKERKYFLFLQQLFPER